jgi:hypothetical protein
MTSVADMGRIHPRRNRERLATCTFEALKAADTSTPGMALALSPRHSPFGNSQLPRGRLHVCDCYAQVQQRCHPHLILRIYGHLLGEAKLATRQVCPSQVFQVCKTVANSSDVVIQKRGFAIVDTHVPAIAISLSPVLYVHMQPRRNRILLGGRHQGARRFVSPGLHRIELASRPCGMMLVMREIHTSIAGNSRNIIL